MARAKDTLLTLGSLAFTAIGIFLLVTGDASDRLMAIGVTAFFGACALVGLMQLVPYRRADLDPDGGLTVKPDRIQTSGMAVAAIGMAVGCTIIAPFAAETNRPVISFAGYAGALFFGAGGVFMLWRVLTDKPLARIDRDGVRTFGVGAWSLLWREITGIEIIAINAQPMLLFSTATGRAHPANPMALSLGVNGTRLRFDEVSALVFDLWKRHGPS